MFSTEPSAPVVTLEAENTQLKKQVRRFESRLTFCQFFHFCFNPLLFIETSENEIFYIVRIRHLLVRLIELTINFGYSENDEKALLFWKTYS
jgi:hypothetical protein